MTIAIGLRATPNEIFYSICEKKNEKISLLNVSKLIIPKALIIPEQLKFIRNTFLDILLEYKINKAGIRIQETIAQKINISRTSFEAVLQELLASSSIIYYYAGQISTIASKIEIPRDDFKKYIENKKDFDKIENWKTFNINEKESILTCLGALNS